MVDFYFTNTALFRSLVYFLIALFSSITTAVYWKAYFNQKRSWIINAVMLHFLSLALSFSYYTIIALINFVGGFEYKYKVLVSLLGIINLPLLYSVINFFLSSVSKNQNGKLKKKNV